MKLLFALLLMSTTGFAESVPSYIKFLDNKYSLQETLDEYSNIFMPKFTSCIVTLDAFRGDDSQTFEDSTIGACVYFYALKMIERGQSPGQIHARTQLKDGSEVGATITLEPLNPQKPSRFTSILGPVASARKILGFTLNHRLLIQFDTPIPADLIVNLDKSIYQVAVGLENPQISAIDSTLVPTNETTKEKALNSQHQVVTVDANWKTKITSRVYGTDSINPLVILNQKTCWSFQLLSGSDDEQASSCYKLEVEKP